MTLRKKIFGSIFILVCAGAITGIVMWAVGPSTPDIEDLLIEPAGALPEIDGSLTELAEDAIPSFNLPSSLTGGFTSYDIEIPDVSVTPPPPNQSIIEIPPTTFGTDDIQQIMDDALAGQTGE
jgi:hypothetical protein